MNSSNPSILQPLTQLTTRLRWVRWLRKLHRFTWIIAGLFLAIFLVDLLLGLRTRELRYVSVLTLASAIVLLVIDWILAWRVRVDLVGLAHLLEQQYPKLAERLVTVVQVHADPTSTANPAFVQLLERETEQQLARVKMENVCPLRNERTRWLVSAPILLAVFAGLLFFAPFRMFGERFAFAWTTSLQPFEIELIHGNGYALVGASYAVEAKLRLLDPYAELPRDFVLVATDDAQSTRVPMKRITSDQFMGTLENLQKPMRFHVVANEVASVVHKVDLIQPPVLAGPPVIRVTGPKYSGAIDEYTTDVIGIEPGTLRYSKIAVRFTLDRLPKQASLVMRAASEKDPTKEFRHPVQWDGLMGASEWIAAAEGPIHAVLVLELEHGLSTTLPIAGWIVRDDLPPRFAQPIRLNGQNVADKPARIAADDALRVQTTVEDAEGLTAIEFEYRINDEPAIVKPWIRATGKTEVKISDWLPLPKALKEDDRVRFRLRAIDNRRIKKDEIADNIPAADLSPHVVTAPAAYSDGDDRWIELRVDRSVEGFLKQQIQAQSAEVGDAIDKIKQKLLSEAQQLTKLKNAGHQQAVLTLDQVQQAANIRVLNQEIVGDLNRAGESIGKHDSLANLAEHFFDIANTEMRQSDQALHRFADKERPQNEREKDLPSAQDAVAKALQKLERMREWNKLLAEDRLDHWQLEKLAKRQQDLADRLQQLLNDPAMNDVDLARQIEEIRQEQARLAAEVARLQEQSRLLQQSMAGMEQKRVERLAKAAEEVARMQGAQEPLSPDSMPAEIAERAGKLAQQQAELAERVKSFADENQGPKSNTAQNAASSLKKRLVEEAIQQQREHEKQLQEWSDKLSPSSPRDEADRLAKQQKKIRDDLEQLAKELPMLKDDVISERMGGLVKRQKDLTAAIAKLPIDRKDEKLRHGLQGAESASKEAGDQLAAKNALASFESMEKAQQALESLAGMLPKSLPQEPSKGTSAKIEQVQKHAAEQKQLREETEKLLADWAKAAGKKAGEPLREKTDKLASNLMELSQKGGPEAKAMAKEAAQAVDMAKKAMDASQTMKEKGQSAEAKMMDDEAAKKLDIVVKQLEKFAQEQAMKMPKDPVEPSAESLKESETQMRLAEKNLPAMPKDAQAAMKNAAQQLGQAAEQTARQAEKNLPRPSRNPAAKEGDRPAPGVGSAVPVGSLESLHGKAWGQLPGELKTRMLQDFRTRFGDDYAEIIQHYFERLAETPDAPRKR